MKSLDELFSSQGSVKPSDVLSRDEILAFTRISTFRGLWPIAFSWSLIAVGFFLAAHFPLWWSIPLAMLIIAGQQHTFAIILHEAAHGSMLRSRKTADILAKYLCGDAIWLNLAHYRRIHLQHHQHTGTAKDPDLALRNGYPAKPWSMARKIFRDLSGLTGLKSVIGFILMDFGFFEHNYNGAAIRTTQRFSLGQRLEYAARHLHGFVMIHGALFGALYAAGHPELYALWWASFLVPYQLFLRIRSIGDHAVTPGGENMLLNTRTTYPNALSLLTVAPLNVSYHIEHHLLSTVPYYRLPGLHRILKQRQVINSRCLSSGYSEILRQAIADETPITANGK